jgi:hypothetical protein
LKALQLVNPDVAPPNQGVSVDVRREGPLLTASFRVESGVAITANPALPVGESQWGLWEWDVVELFVSCDPGRLPYYEFQVSPLGQRFELEIFEPRKRFNRDFRSGFESSARRLSETSWEAEMRIPLDQLGWDRKGASLAGNAYAILGPAAARTYWSLFLGPQAKPDFHLPQQFHKID